jgi:hypothetical protein
MLGKARFTVVSCPVSPLQFCQVEFLLGGLNEFLHGVISWLLCLLDDRIVIPVTRPLLPRKSDCPRENDPDHRSRVLIYIPLHAQMILRRFPPRLELSMYGDPVSRKRNRIDRYWSLMQKQGISTFTIEQRMKGHITAGWVGAVSCQTYDTMQTTRSLSCIIWAVRIVWSKTMMAFRSTSVFVYRSYTAGDWLC